ncbi:hypothetical protein COCSUDRAFT_42141 [Coccomyxa subellipsoidea C-169]|uniref:F-box domain-containing protein n=1 Tax=Coccomyxa subellipsoidea (strain C-169) TaxID=574566 RepID=I0YXV7_COCSC|nr:hypothetical protein COCSUDRAFT_42141 [Coccomyxa subellipsoidea C-169]EIE23226.1 hypothetical protein COCSUDRAFT_42141 [Coccomyxa subellipsoidea C-169]|eukprot:XP_005647770.1 hypothetical protein COCSUDRAFT_42141 [Coccomyxa subellipsoidea C-169]
MESSEEPTFAREPTCRRRYSSAHQAEGLPVLPADVLRKILELVGVEWRGRRVQAAKEEVREWTQYCLVSREWRAAFQDLPLCIEFDEAPSRRQVQWLRTTNAPIRRVTFLPAAMPCRSTVSALVTRACDSIRLAPLHTDHAAGGVPARSIGAAA